MLCCGALWWCSVSISAGNKGKCCKMCPAQGSSGCISRISFSPEYCVLFTTFWLSCNSFSTFTYSLKEFHGSLFDYPGHRGSLVGHCGPRSVSVHVQLVRQPTCPGAQGVTPSVREKQFLKHFIALLLIQMSFLF